jgi:hypothetical protein|tara:strand:+ start:387 stop:500 length:114 start_codon:yes stop_codon:yes gene_type:complete
MIKLFEFLKMKWVLLTEKKAPVKRGRPKGSKNKPKTK